MIYIIILLIISAIVNIILYTLIKQKEKLLNRFIKQNAFNTAAIEAISLIAHINKEEAQMLDKTFQKIAKEEGIENPFIFKEKEE